MSEESISDLSFDDNEFEEGLQEFDEGDENQAQLRNKHYSSLTFDQGEGQTIKNEFIKEEAIKEEADQIWNPVIYKNDDPNQNRRVKFEYRENSLYPVKVVKRKKKTQNLNMSDPAQAKAHLQQLAKEYHKNLLDEVMEQQRIKQEAGIKDEDQVIHLDSTLNRFPIYNPAMREKTYKSIDEFKSFLISQQQEILSQLNDPAITSVFVSSLEEVVKPSNTAKQYINFKCKIVNCQAILKCVVTVEECELYTIRNKHNHTITGEVLPGEGKVKPTETIVIDEELHKMFDINKGVRSETRNIKYMDPEEKKLEKKRRLMKSRQEQTEQGEDIESAERPARIVKKNKSKSKSKNNSKAKDGKKSDVQFTNVAEQLEKQGYKVYAYHKEGIDSLFPSTFCLTKEEMVRGFLTFPVLRLAFVDHAIKLDKKKYPECSNWSIILVTAHNSALNSVVVAVFLILNTIAANISRVFSILLKIFPDVKYLVTEYRPENKYFVPDLPPGSPLKILLDTDDVYHLLKKEMKDPKRGKIIKEMLKPSSIPLERFTQFFRQCKESSMTEKYDSIKEHLILEDVSRSFLEFGHSLRLQRQLIAKVKARLRGGTHRYTFKSQLQILMETLLRHNKEATETIDPKAINIMELERAHEDSGLRMVRQSVAPNVLNHFYLQYCRLPFLKIKQNQNGRWVFEDGCEVQNWSCSCAYARLTGVPCKHLIFVLKEQRKNYLGLFHRKWVINDGHSAEQQIGDSSEEFAWRAIGSIEQRGKKETSSPQDRSRSRDRPNGRFKKQDPQRRGEKAKRKRLNSESQELKGQSQALELTHPNPF